MFHQTAKEYLLDNSKQHSGDWRRPTETEAHSTLTWVCLKFLQFKTFDEPPWPASRHSEAIEEAVLRVQDKRTFLSYSARDWPKHLPGWEEDPSLDIIFAALRLCTVKTGFCRTWRAICIGLTTEEIDGWDELAVASESGLVPVVEYILNQRCSINDRDTGQAALPSSGSKKVVAKMLATNASIDNQHSGFVNALQAAASGGHGQILTMLLLAGADVDVQGGRLAMRLWEQHLGNRMRW